jgi:hypothetical protein
MERGGGGEKKGMVFRGRGGYYNVGGGEGD